jgi:hypothetical protein
MAWLLPPAAAPTGTWTRQGQRRIDHAAGGAKQEINLIRVILILPHLKSLNNFRYPASRPIFLLLALSKVIMVKIVVAKRPKPFLGCRLGPQRTLDAIFAGFFITQEV